LPHSAREPASEFGIGQALMEQTVYDPDSGRLLSGSFMDYGMPPASDLPNFGIGFNEVPCKTNALGTKGAGEAGSVGALAAVMNAVVGALSPIGVEHIGIPVTPHRIWRTLHEAKERR
jgi:aerobic carbon-monoxide dehydrogenase large subunit